MSTSNKSDLMQEKEVCRESGMKWFERIPEALASILEENTNDKATSEEHSGNSAIEETAQKSKAKNCLGRGMRVLIPG